MDTLRKRPKKTDGTMIKKQKLGARLKAQQGVCLPCMWETQVQSEMVPDQSKIISNPFFLVVKYISLIIFATSHVFSPFPPLCVTLAVLRYRDQSHT